MKELSPELKQRVKTGVIGGVLFLFLIIFGGWIGITFLTAGLCVGMANEFAKMVYQLPDATEKRYGLLSLAWFAALINGFSPRVEFEVLIVCFFIVTMAFLIWAKKYELPQLNRHFREMMYTLFGLFYVVFLPAHLPKIHESPNGVHWTVLFFLIIWSCDTGAYFGGKKWGKRKLYPEISPKKTVEGALSGLGAAFAVCLLYKLIFFRAGSWAMVLIAPFLVGTIAQVGDLVESFLKRAFDIKDSGSILPGHGGFLDRFDSVIYSLPVMYACVRILS